MKEDLKTDITRNVTWKMRIYANKLLHGTIEKQFGKLWFYGTKVLHTNSGSTIILLHLIKIFHNIDICFETHETCFMNGC